MTLTEIYAAVRALAVRPNLSDTILSVAATNVESEINRELSQHPRNFKRATIVMPTDEDITDIVPLPTDMASLITFRDSDNNVITNRPPTYVPLDSSEVYFIPRGDVLQIFPFPDSYETYYIDYIGFITPLTQDSENWVSTYFSDLYIYGILKEIAMLTKKDERFTLWQAEFLRRLSGVLEQGWNQNIGAAPVRVR
jgi:hypothetical protein